MRLVGGSLAGRRLKAPAGNATRPTSDRVREALFNILTAAGNPPDRVLDLFAGAGTLGLEAISRGATDVVFVDSARPAIRCLKQNIEALAVQKFATVQCRDSLQALRSFKGVFDVVFLDPPYAGDLADKALRHLGERTLLTPDGIVIVEHDRRQPTDQRYGHLVRSNTRRYGDTELSFYRQGEK